MTKHPIVPHLWFNTEAKEAAELYTSIFDHSSIKNIRTITGTPSGDCDIVTFSLAGLEFMAISAGPYFTFTPAISLSVICSSKEDIDRIWAALEGDKAPLMPLMAYPFSEYYGWCKDRYGLTWQLMYQKDAPEKQKIIPSFLFAGNVCGKTEEAMQFYTSLFPNSHIDMMANYDEHDPPQTTAKIKYATFTLNGQSFAAMDSGYPHAFTFNEAVSLIVTCDTQAEIDFYFEKLSAVPESEQCGWLKDKFGVSWQIVPARMNDMMETGSKEQVDRVTASFLTMKKFDIAALEAAFAGK